LITSSEKIPFDVKCNFDRRLIITERYVREPTENIFTSRYNNRVLSTFWRNFMTCMDGYMLAVTDANKAAYLAMALEFSTLLKGFGALRIVECWGDAEVTGLMRWKANVTEVNA
jgi:hypothetical protein